MPDESTTPDLIEHTRRSMEAWNSGDFDGAMSMFSPNSVWDATGRGVGVYEGHAAIRAYLVEWTGILDDLQFELEEIVELGHGIIFAVALTSGRMKGSSGELDMRWAVVAEWADDLIMRVAAYSDIDAARAAAERLATERGSAISCDRVQMARGLIELWNSGDRSVGKFEQFLHPAIELESPLSSIAGEPYRGYAGMDGWVRDLEEQFVEWSVAVDDVRQVDDQVIAVVTVTARGRASDISLQFSSAGVFKFASDHRITRARIYPGVKEALKAVGLEG